MKVLIAIVTCVAYRHRAAAQRATWAQEVQGADVRFFIGGNADITYPDEVVLPVDDNYYGLPAKVQATLRWALDNGYTHVFKCDDDVYVQSERLLASGFEKHHYTGRLRGPSGQKPAPYASGFGYWLSAHAASIVAGAALDGDTAEDRWVANVLHQHGIQCYPDYRYVVVTAGRNARSGFEGPRRGNNFIAACEFDTPQAMKTAHHQYKTLYSHTRNQAMPPRGNLDRIAVMIKTFLRDGYLLAAVAGVQKTMPEVKMVVVDDGLETRTKIPKYAELRAKGHSCVWLPFDSGFGAKANAAIEHCDREYVLIGSDDFDFGQPNVRAGVERLQAVLDHDPTVAVASGRVDGNPYEGFIERGVDYIKEVRLRDGENVLYAGAVPYQLCDLTVNYSLVRRCVLGMNKVHWHAEWKIGGDHYTFFDDIRKAGYRIAYVPDVHIKQMPYLRHWMDARYPVFRARAKQALPSFFAKQGIKRYIGFDGRVDTV